MIINRDERLDPAGMKMVLAIPFTRIEATGTINGTNKEFYLTTVEGGKYIPFYPASHKDIIVKTTDITAELFKDATPDTYTDAPITGIKTATVDSVAVDAGVELTTAPATLTTDKVLLSGYFMVWMRIVQDITPSIKRGSEEISEVGVADKIKTLGSRSREVKYEIIMTKDALTLLTDIWKEPYADQTGVASGYEKLTERDAPLKLKGFIPVVYDGTELQRYLLSDIELEEDMLNVKAGDSTTKLTVNMLISDPIDVLRATA